MSSSLIFDQKMQFIDLRSDTVTWPTHQMRLAMANAQVGDDVIGDDWTVKKLEADAATLMGKEAALFVTSGTQGNLISVMVHCKRGEEIILGDLSHIFIYEAAGVSAVAGVMPHCVPVQADGTLRLEDIQNAIRTIDDHYPTTSLIVIENTHNRRGGVPLTVEYTNAVAALAKKNKLKLHIDGARIFNAATALGVEVKELVKNADSVSFCLSKALCAPIGSIICGTKEFITEARRKRIMLGGGLRQSGILAAAGLIALHKMSTRLHEDHIKAKQLAEGLSSISGIKVLTCYTNFVWFELIDKFLTADELHQTMRQNKIFANAYIGNKWRCALHYWINSDDIQTVVRVLKDTLEKRPSKL